MALTANVNIDWRTPDEECLRRTGLNPDRYSRDGGTEMEILVSSAWTARIGPEVVFEAFGRKIKRDGTPSMLRGRVRLSREQVPDHIRATLLRLLSEQVRHEKRALYAADVALQAEIDRMADPVVGTEATP